MSEVTGSVGGPDSDADQRLPATSRLLVIDDDAALAEMLSLVLQNEGFDPIWCGHGDQALDAYRQARPDLVLLDVMLPGKNGMMICREIRAESRVPIVMLTARSDTVDVVAGLEAGADDFIAKPFRAKELIARIKTRLRGSRQEAVPAVVDIGDLVIDVDGHSVRRGETVIQLTPLEFELLLVLARRPQQVFSREMLLEEVWGYHGPGADARLVNVHVQRLRAKMEVDHEHPKVVITIRGVGYTAGDPAEPPSDESL